MSKWIENLRATLLRHPVVILHGNVRDIYVDGQGTVYNNLTSLLGSVCKSLPIRFDDVTCYDAVVGQRRSSPKKPTASTPGAGENELAQTAPVKKSQGERADPSRVFAGWMQQVRGDTESHLIVFNYLDKCVAYRKTYDEDEMQRILWLEKVIENATPSHRIIFVALQDSMVPTELYVNSPKATLFTVPSASEADRETLLRRRSGHLDSPTRTLLAKLTEGMFLMHVNELARELADQEEPPSRHELTRLVNKYRLGEREDHWGNLSIDQIRNAYQFFVEQEGVRGQDEAIAKIIDTLCLARAGLVGLASGTTARPKGVLFFAGPTGVGKTMMAKKLAKFLFSSEEAFIRFDMSEFKEDHTVSKLLGSPPGYVGFEDGGMLTNAVRDRPFSVVLFDEIEKAHPKILDVFLQILDDGRVTDSHGQTVFFSESIIIFTSNIGARSTASDGSRITEQAVLSQLLENEELEVAEQHASVRQHFLESVERFFVDELSRPELLNRIGNRIVPFNPVSSPEIQREIMDSHLRRIKEEIEDRHREKKYRIDFDENVADHLVDRHGTRVVKYGGRASTNVLEDEIMTPMAQQMLNAEDASQTDVTFHCAVDPERQRIHVVRR